VLTADRYRGAVAAGYDAHRMQGPEWAPEQAAIADLVTDGPVLDVPIGTGRFLPIYQAARFACVGIDISPEMLSEARKKQTQSDRLMLGDIFQLPFAGRSFATAVCTRFLNWCEPIDMRRAIGELRRVAHCLIVGLRTGKQGLHGNYTHDIAEFYDAIDGLFIAERRPIRRVDSGLYEIFKLRLPTVDDVRAQFGVNNGINWSVKKAADWTRHFGLPEVDWERASISAEYWSHDRIAALISEMAKIEYVGGCKHEMITNELPSRDYGPLTILRTAGHEVMLDGRRRANLWMKLPGRYPCLVVTC
jgi:SAM-dependent methyltransferase